MRVVLLSFPGWLCLLCAPARSGSTASARSTANSSKSTIRPNPEETQTEMASTALDFREMMRKERERAMKKRATAASAYKARWFLVRRSSPSRLWPTDQPAFSDDRSAALYEVLVDGCVCLLPVPPHFPRAHGVELCAGAVLR